MKRKGLLLLISLLSFVLATAPGCRKYEQIRIGSGSIESLSMNGLRSADVILSVEVVNPAGKIVLEDVGGVLKHSGKILGNITLAPLTVAARTTADYRVTATLELDKGVSLIYLMSLMDVKKLKECTVDVHIKGKASGVRLKREFKDIPVKKLLEGHYYEKI